ncbi:MAG: hypothetical protein JWN42_515 [Candidatus Angelobacter sp.]|nr:hypothetical protein [Candidatus Angelobacter sp.]
MNSSVDINGFMLAESNECKRWVCPSLSTWVNFSATSLSDGLAIRLLLTDWSIIMRGRSLATRIRQASFH